MKISTDICIGIGSREQTDWNIINIKIILNAIKIVKFA